MGEFKVTWVDERMVLTLPHTRKSLAECTSHSRQLSGAWSPGFQLRLIIDLASDAIESRFGLLRQLSGEN